MEAAGIDLTIPQWAVMLQLFRGGELTHQELADRTFRHHTTMTRMIDQLVEKNYACRSRSAKDRRVTVLSLTDEGHALVRRILPLALQMLSVATADTTPEEQALFAQTLRKLEARLIADETA